MHDVVKPFIKGSKVLDLACGTGYYSRYVLEWGAAKVVGIDISKPMIEEAQKALSGLEASFYVGDLSQPNLKVEGRPFDIVIGSWLLNYAETSEAMLEMWRNIAANLRPGGRFVGIAPVPQSDPAIVYNDSYAFDQKYGVTSSILNEVEDGFKVHVVGLTHPQEVHFDCFHLRKEIYETTAREAGMRGKLEWKRISIPNDETDKKDLLQDENEGFFDDYVQKPRCGILVAEK